MQNHIGTSKNSTATSMPLLQSLRQREFAAGRYNPVIASMWQLFPIGPNSPAPGAQHSSIEEAMEDADADGTRSILDLDHVGDEPDFCTVVPLPDEVLEELFETTQPTRAMVEANMDFMESIERGPGYVHHPVSRRKTRGNLLRRIFIRLEPTNIRAAVCQKTCLPCVRSPLSVRRGPKSPMIFGATGVRD